jgi:hypothetical protein
MFVEGGYEAYAAHRGLVTFTCARAIYETVACVFEFCDTLKDKLVENDFKKIAKFLAARQFAARMEKLSLIRVEPAMGVEFDNKAVNVLKCIDKLSKHLPNLRQDYEFLSERTHPNCLGALDYFWVSGEDDKIKFSIPGDQRDALKSLIEAGRLMALMELRISETEREIDAYCRTKAQEWFGP